MKPSLQLILYADVPILKYFSNQKEDRFQIFSFTETFTRFIKMLKDHRGQVEVKLAIPPAYFALIDQIDFKSEMDSYLRETEIVHSYWKEYNGNIISVISSLIDDEKLELLGLPATGVLLPFLKTSEGIEVQIHTGKNILHDLFGVIPKGFWFPKGAYAPGLDYTIVNSSYIYSYIDESSFMVAEPTPTNDGSMVKSPHGLIVQSIHNNLSNYFVNSDEEKGCSFGQILKKELLNWVRKNNQAPIAIAADLDLFMKKEDILKTISYFADEGYIKIIQNELLPESIDTAHICSSFLLNESLENEFMSISNLLSQHIWMEQELQQLLTISLDPKEQRIVQQMVREWMMFSTCLFTNQRSVHHYAGNYIKNFKKLYAFLAGDEEEILIKREKELVLLEKLQIASSSSYNKEDFVKPAILVLSWEFPPNIVGGLARHVYGLAKSLVKKGYEIHVITAGTEDLIDEEWMDGIRVFRVKPLNQNEKDFLKWVAGLNIVIVEKAENLSSMYQYDCIHAHDWLVGEAAISLKKQMDLPLVTTIHATEYGRNNGIYTEMQQFIHEKERKLIEITDQIIVCSDYMKEEVENLFGPPAEKIISIPNGIENEKNKRDLQNQLNTLPLDSNRRLIFSIGRMVREKGFDTLIEAALVLKENNSNVYFIIAGKGPMLEEYRRMVIDKDLSDTVYFIGFINDDIRNALFELCDIAVFPSLYEPFGIVALESMKAKKPTIVSNTGGLKGIVKHLTSGLHMIPGNTESLVEQINYLLNNPLIAEQIGENGKKIVDSLFSWNRVAEETKRVYEEVMTREKIKCVRDNV